MACRRKLTRRGVEPECDDAVRVLIGRQQEFTGRVNRKVPGSLSLRALVPDARERAVRLIDGIDHDAIVSAIRAVKELSRGRDLHLRARACSSKVPWER